MATRMDNVFREQLVNRRQRLTQAIPHAHDPSQLEDLLDQVDAALGRLEDGTFGLCENCHDSIETDRLLADPLITFCLDHLTPKEQRALEQDLELAARIQKGLLPDRNLLVGNFQISYHYEPAGPVSGDYCDIVNLPDGSFYFMLGDVAGKGVAASMLMSQLHAIFRTLISIGQPLDQMLARASRLFCESSLPAQFATLVCGKVSPSGDVELCNAGHLPSLLVKGNAVVSLESTSLPVGMFCSQEFVTRRIRLEKGDSLILTTDGVSEAQNSAGVEYGIERLVEQVERQHRLPPQSMIESVLEDLKSFRGPSAKTDDLSMMALRRVA